MEFCVRLAKALVELVPEVQLCIHTTDLPLCELVFLYFSVATSYYTESVTHSGLVGNTITKEHETLSLIPGTCSYIEAWVTTEIGDCL